MAAKAVTTTLSRWRLMFRRAKPMGGGEDGEVLVNNCIANPLDHQKVAANILNAELFIPFLAK
ncbi:hypothetical protein GBZ26_07450 [Azospirillum formosense]|uniref:Uncharacterized protein n=1 Tax=Azospirillum formosense TaxID=861533 RepID=A0ABX2KTQ9_9PROT|nr:hypothetical protein [Azospirillum formosense]MBY3755883.1 hypothetical protein [Azospirillum formosense]NUB19047.1 hypothetical protein [Azospirillum formosense]